MAARWRSPSGHQWTIAAGAQRATIVEVGGGVREYAVGGVDVVDGYPADAICPWCAGQVLAPWPNRIRDGRYGWEGEELQLPLDEPARQAAVHGLVRWEMWDRTEHTPNSVTVARTVQPRPGYPFALTLSVRWSVGPGGLRADHVATNVGDRPAPFGLGAHPYLTLGRAPVDGLVLRLPAGRRVLVDDRLLPTGEDEPVDGTPYDFRGGRQIGETDLDTAFAVTERGADGLARSSLVGPDGQGVEMWQDESFGWVQTYTGTGPSEQARRAVAVEPMSCPPDAFRSGVDVVTLQPGARWRGSWGIRPIG